MNIADRIQQLRKSKGLSQEELADQIGVSRQAVSKWESEQTSPDIEKVILLSNYFETTTDYLLKGVEPLPAEIIAAKEKPNASIFTITGTAFNIMGLIVAAMIWYEEQVATATAIGLILIIMGCMIYGIGMTISNAETLPRAKHTFWIINVWILVFLPLSLLYNVLLGVTGAPYPLLIGSPVWYVLFWMVYLIIGIAVNLVLYKSRKNRNLSEAV